MIRKMTNTINEVALISIGGLARASGVPVETLRNWERRYGFPDPVRRDSGHRRYTWDVVERLRLIRKVLEMGYKPSYAVAADEENLERILKERERDKPAGNEHPEMEGIDRELTDWLISVKNLDAVGLEVGLSRSWSRYGAYDFITGLMVPFLREVGELWAQKKYTVAQEHFASEVVESFLAGHWRPLSQRARGSSVVLANLEGELHNLGIHMAAVFLALNDLEVVFLGANTPLEDIVVAAHRKGVAAVIIGLAASTEVNEAAARLGEIRHRLPTTIVVAVGGNEQLPVTPGVVSIETFEDFYDWVRALAEATGSPLSRQ